MNAAQTLLNRVEVRRDFIQRVELPGDAMLLIYLTVLVRQCLWWISASNAILWTLSTLVGVVCVSIYVFTRRPDDASASSWKKRLPFWLIVVVPLVFVYAMRVVFPDVSFDVLNYRIFHAERSMSGLLFRPDEFFPTPAPYNPAPDMVTGLFRHALGYRLGTIANLLAMVWTAQVVDKLLRPFVRNTWLRAAGVLLAVSAEHLLFEINNYMADLLAVPLVLEATYLALNGTSRDSKKGDVDARNLICIALLLGISVAFKLTNASVALPVVLLCAYRAIVQPRVDGVSIAGRIKQLAVTALLCASAFLAPLLPFSFYLYRDTGSPVFPVFNGIFKSVFWPPHSIWDPRWGPVGMWEKLAWPVLISLHPERLSELAVYSGRISLAFVVAIPALIFARRDRRLRELYLLFICGALLWSASTGYIRYALSVEILATLVLLTLAAKLFEQVNGRRIAQAIGGLLLIGLTFQTVLSFYFVSHQEWSQRPTLFTMPGSYLRESRHLFRDHSLRPFVDAETLKRIDEVEVWIGTGTKTSAITVTLRPDAPTLGAIQGEFFSTPESRDRFRRALKGVEGKRMFSLVSDEKIEAVKRKLRDRGLIVVDAAPLEIPFYSPRVRIGATLLELKTVAAYNKETVKP